jgi:hypothetical protein
VGKVVESAAGRVPGLGRLIYDTIVGDQKFGQLRMRVGWAAWVVVVKVVVTLVLGGAE